MDDGGRIRKRVAGLGPRRRGARLPQDLRREIAEHTRRRRSEGARASEIAEQIGVSEESLRRWASKVPRPNEVSLVPVRVRPEAAGPNGIVVHTAQGHRVTGLDMEGAARLLRTLR
jgi:hypothetical protein